MGKEEIKLLIFVDNMMVSIENPKQASYKSLEFISKLRMFTCQKVNIKIISFVLAINNSKMKCLQFYN